MTSLLTDTSLPPATSSQTDPRIVHETARKAHWDAYADKRQRRRRPDWSSYYHRRLIEIYRNLVPPGLRVLELGSAQGDLLAALQPSHGVGVDFSAEMIRLARQRHPGLHFVQASVQEMTPDETFDVIILSDLVNDLWDVQSVFTLLKQACHPRTRIILNFYSRLWQLPLGVAKRLGLAKPTLDQNWLTAEDITNFLYLTDFEVLKRSSEILWPLGTPLLAPFCNRFLAKFWPGRWFALTNVVVARPKPVEADRPLRVSVVVPARNEAGNIPQIVGRVPEMGAGTEIIFVEGNSSDDTPQAIDRAVRDNPHRNVKALTQAGKGKGDAVRRGFALATGDVLMILDADLTVAPEDLPRFFEAVRSGKADFANGVRLVYPMEQRAMRFANLVGNKFFSLAFSWILSQPVKDTLCGTKVIRREDYEMIAANRAYFGEFDPFGDFDLLFGAARLGLKIADVPVRYGERTYGTTNIQRWKHGLLLLRMAAFGARRLRFI